MSNGSFDIKHDESFYWLLSSFSAVSAREDSGAENLNKFLGRDDVPVVVDQTLLLDLKDHQNIIYDNCLKFKCVFIYSLMAEQDFQNLASKVAAKLNLPIVTVFSSRMTVKDNSKIRISKYNAPGDFLSLIKNTEFVITNSFHGTAFSIKFEKEFFLLLIKIPVT